MENIILKQARFGSIYQGVVDSAWNLQVAKIKRIIFLILRRHCQGSVFILFKRAETLKKGFKIRVPYNSVNISEYLSVGETQVNDSIRDSTPGDSILVSTIKEKSPF